MEYHALIEVHVAWQTDDKGQAKARSASDYPDLYDTYAMILLDEL